jgi:RNA polymerase sigma factor (TIGR02999 family)
LEASLETTGSKRDNGDVAPSSGPWIFLVSSGDPPLSHDVTQLLRAITEGRDSGVNELLPVVYDELRRLAETFLQQERADHTLQATALVHEAYLKLVDQRSARWQDRAHFFAVAAQAMRRILVDHARTHGRAKRGGGLRPVSLDGQAELAHQPDADLVVLDEALERLAQDSPESIRVVEMRYFAGMTIDETATALGVSTSTIERDWRYARAWLFRELADRTTDNEGTGPDGQPAPSPRG